MTESEAAGCSQGITLPAACLLEVRGDVDAEAFVNAVRSAVRAACGSTRDALTRIEFDPIIVDESHSQTAVEVALSDARWTAEGPAAAVVVRGYRAAHTETYSLLAVTLHPSVGDVGALRDLLTLAMRFSRHESDVRCVPYPLFSEWEASLCREPAPGPARSYWRTRAQRRSPTPLSMQPASDSLARWRTTQVPVPERLAAALGDENGLGLERVRAVICASWLITAQRLSGQRTVEANLGVDRRSTEFFGSVIGPTLRWLPIAMSLDRDLTIRSLCDELQTELREAEQWQSYVHEMGDVGGGVTGTVELADTGLEVVDWPDFSFGSAASLHALSVVGWSEPLEIAHRVVRLGQEWCVQTTWDATRFDNDAIDGIVRGWLEVARIACERSSPQVRVDSISLAAGHADPIDGPEAPAAVPDLNRRLSSMADRLSDRTCVYDSSGSMTWSELAHAARAVSSQLRMHGVRRGDRILVVCERSRNYPAIVWAALDVGACFLPIDPALGGHAIDSRAAALDTRAVVTDCPWESAVETVIVVDSTPAVSDADVSSVFAAESWDSLAYGIWTSGSTGEPKAVAVSTRTLREYVARIGAFVGLTPDDVYVHLASIGFSSSIRQLLAPLAAGSSVLLVPSDIRRDPLAVIDWIRSRRPTVLDVTPTFLDAMAFAQFDSADRRHGLPESIHTVLCASEPLLNASVARFRETLGFEGRILSMYGTTESCGLIAGGALPVDCADVGLAAIGPPLPGVRVRVLDPFLHLLPLGVPGEIYVEEPAVAASYLERPAETAAAFVPSPYATGTRMFRTFDRGRLKADGQLELFGRSDDVVKIRGERVSLLDVASAAENHPAIRSAAAVMIDLGGGPELAVAAAVDRGVTVSGQEVRDFLRERVLRAEFPTRVVVVDRLPTLPSGKLDRRAVSALVSGPVDQREPVVGPENALEAELLVLWQDVLPNREVGVTDNFFDIGGHSLKAAQVVARVQRALGLRLSVGVLFTHSTIRELATFIRSSRG